VESNALVQSSISYAVVQGRGFCWPIREKVNPPLDVSSGFLVDSDVVVDGSNGGTEVNQVPKEDSSWGLVPGGPAVMKWLR